MTKSKSGKDLRAQAKNIVGELPDETSAGRMVDDRGSPASADRFGADKAEAMNKAAMDPMPMPGDDERT